MLPRQGAVAKRLLRRSAAYAVRPKTAANPFNVSPRLRLPASRSLTIVDETGDSTYHARMIRLTQEPINPTAVLDEVSSNDAGAVVLFLGTTREYTHGRRTASLDYECYPE